MWCILHVRIIVINIQSLLCTHTISISTILLDHWLNSTSIHVKVLIECLSINWRLTILARLANVRVRFIEIVLCLLLIFTMINYPLVRFLRLELLLFDWEGCIHSFLIEILRSFKVLMFFLLIIWLLILLIILIQVGSVSLIGLLLDLTRKSLFQMRILLIIVWITFSIVLEVWRIILCIIIEHHLFFCIIVLSFWRIDWILFVSLLIIIVLIDLLLFIVMFLS